MPARSRSPSRARPLICSQYVCGLPELLPRHRPDGEQEQEHRNFTFDDSLLLLQYRKDCDNDPLFLKDMERNQLHDWIDEPFESDSEYDSKGDHELDDSDPLADIMHDLQYGEDAQEPEPEDAWGLWHTPARLEKMRQDERDRARWTSRNDSRRSFIDMQHDLKHGEDKYLAVLR